MFFYLITMIIGVVGMIVQQRLRSKFNEYSQFGLMNGLTGKEIAERMLRDNGIYDVKVIQVDGELTDHYNPSDKTVNLSSEVYYGNSASSAAVAAHECGHAVQHATAYSMLQFRSSMVPALSIASKFLPIVLGGGLMLYFYSHNALVLTIGVAIFALTTVFSFVTLPVEFDASNRALKWMQDKNIVNTREHEMAKDALKWAAMTYVVAAVGSLAQLLYYVSLLTGGRRSDD